MTAPLAETSTRYHHGDLRKALLVAAEAELAEKGVEGFTLRGCAKRAGVSHAAPAHHFRDANALLTALAAIGFERLSASMSARQSRAPAGPQSRLVAGGLGYIDFAEANPALFKLMFGSNRPATRDEALHAKASAAFTALLDALADARGPDPLSSREGIIDIAAAWAVVHGLAHLLIDDKMDFLKPALAEDRDAVIETIASRVMDRS